MYSRAGKPLKNFVKVGGHFEFDGGDDILVVLMGRIELMLAEVESEGG